MSTDPSFRMTVKDIYIIQGRGTVVTGKVESGTLSVGDEVHWKRQGFGGSDKKAVVMGIDKFQRQLTQAQVGDKVGVFLGELTKQDVQSGDVLIGYKDLPDLYLDDDADTTR